MKNILKKILILFSIIVSSISCKAQPGVILPINYNTRLFSHIENGTYIKDVANTLLPYTGNWQGTWQGKTILFKIERVKITDSSPNGDYHYEDTLIVNYKITDNNTGNILHDNITVPDINVNITTSGREKNNELTFFYINGNLCSSCADFYLIKNLSNANQLTYRFNLRNGFWIENNCPYSSVDSIPMIIPEQQVILTKVP
jgi:hypothetical protein